LSSNLRLDYYNSLSLWCFPTKNLRAFLFPFAPSFMRTLVGYKSCGCFLSSFLSSHVTSSVRSKESAAGLLRSSADHRPIAPVPIPAKQETALPVAVNIAKVHRGRVVEMCPVRVCPSACNSRREPLGGFA
jgi:hypothetical protein